MKSNAIDEATGKRLSTRQLLKKVPNVPCLYRHKLNLRYYGIKSVRGKLISDALRTEHEEPITDRKIAERRLKEWVESLEGGTSPTGAPQTLEALIERYRQTKAGLKEKTKINVEWTIKNLLKRWTLGTDKRIREIRVSDIDAMLATTLISCPKSAMPSTHTAGAHHSAHSLARPRRMLTAGMIPHSPAS